MEHLSEYTVCRNRTVPRHFIFPVRKYGWIWVVADVRRDHHQLFLLFSGGVVGEEKACGRNADDTKDNGVYLDDMFGGAFDMTFSMQFGILFLVALFCCMIGFYKYIYFISIGYGLAISGQGIAMLILFREKLTIPLVISCLILTLYGFRLSGFLLFREIKSSSYQKHMKTEIKDGSDMNIGVKAMLWIFCGILYLFMIAPVFYRYYNGNTGCSVSFVIGTVLMAGGILLESLADLSKSRQKKKNPKRFCDKGLFRLVRCPNYLGELILWTGVLVVGITSLQSVGQWIVALLGYLGIVFVMFSGARRLEVRQNKNYGTDPEYQKYVKTVPILIPFVPLYSVEKYKFLVL